MDITTSAILDALRSVGSSKGIVYVTVPITTGLREFQLMRELACTREELRSDPTKRERWTKDVKEANEADAEAYSLMVQLQNPDRLVLNPAALQVEGWTQSQYSAMWNEVLSEFCDKLVVTPDWAFSVGARHEVQQMFSLNRAIVDVFGNPLTSDSVEKADTLAKEQLLEMGWERAIADEMLPPVHVPKMRKVVARPFANDDFDSAVKWLIDARSWQNRIQALPDRRRTEVDGPRAERGLWRKKLDKYLDLAREQGIDTPEGGTFLLAFVSLAIAMMEEVSTVFGQFPEPGKSTGDKIQVSRINAPEMSPNQRLAVIFAWLLRELFYVRTRFPEDVDDENTRQGIGRDSWWSRQLNIYWIRAHQAGLDTPKGRQALGKFTSTAMGLAVSRIRLYGIPPKPKRLTAEELRDLGLFESFGEEDEQ